MHSRSPKLTTCVLVWLTAVSALAGTGYAASLASGDQPQQVERVGAQRAGEGTNALARTRGRETSEGGMYITLLACAFVVARQIRRRGATNVVLC